MVRVCSQCDVGLHEWCGHGCRCPVCWSERSARSDLPNGVRGPKGPAGPVPRSWSVGAVRPSGPVPDHRTRPTVPSVRAVRTVRSDRCRPNHPNHRVEPKNSTPGDLLIATPRGML